MWLTISGSLLLLVLAISKLDRAKRHACRMPRTLFAAILTRIGRLRLACDTG